MRTKKHSQTDEFSHFCFHHLFFFAKFIFSNLKLKASLLTVKYFFFNHGMNFHAKFFQNVKMLAPQGILQYIIEYLHKKI